MRRVFLGAAAVALAGARLPDGTPPVTPDRVRGMNLAGAEAGSGTAANVPGTLSPTYSWGSAQYVLPPVEWARRCIHDFGVTHFRVPFLVERWEANPAPHRRFVHQLLAVDERVTVTLDMHNYGKRWAPDGTRLILGQGWTNQAYADAWARIATLPGLFNHPRVSFDLMNEPAQLSGPSETLAQMQAGAQIMETAYQTVITQLRAAGVTSWLKVEPYQYASIERAHILHPAWTVNDPLGRTIVSGHFYLDGSGSYLTPDQMRQLTFAEVEAARVAAGEGTLQQRADLHLRRWFDWVNASTFPASEIGEVGWSRPAEFQELGDRVLRRIIGETRKPVSVVYWGLNPAWSDPDVPAGTRIDNALMPYDTTAGAQAGQINGITPQGEVLALNFTRASRTVTAPPPVRDWDTVTIPLTLGVQYRIGNVVTDYGPRPVSGSVTVTAEPKDHRFTLAGTRQWTLNPPPQPTIQPWHSLHLNGPEYGIGDYTAPAGTFSNVSPGVYDTDYHYESQESLTYFASRGWKVVKVPLRWERVQTSPSGPLRADEIARLDGFMNRAHTAGLQVILDIHNYGHYYLSDGTQGVATPIGAAALPVAAFADLWTKLATRYRSHPAIYGYAIMAEPQDSAGLTVATWKQASQAAVNAIRAVDVRSEIHVAGFSWSSTRFWDVNGAPWIVDTSGGTTRYEAHHYWDGDASGEYANTYAAEVAAAQAAGWTPSGYPTALHARIASELRAYQTWLTTHGVKGIIGEAGWPHPSPEWDAFGGWYLARVGGSPVSVWDAGEWTLWDALRVYDGYPQATPLPKAAVLEPVIAQAPASAGVEPPVTITYPTVAATSTKTHSASTAGVTAETVPRPAGVQAGDLLILFSTMDAGTLADLVQPTGWTQMQKHLVGSGLVAHLVAYKIATASEPATYTMGRYSASSDGCSMIVAVRGWSGVAANLRSAVQTTPRTAGAVPAVTAVGAGLVLVSAAHDNNGSTAATWAWTPPAGCSMVVEMRNAGGWAASAVASRTVPAGGQVSGMAWAVVTAAANANMAAAAVAIPAATG